MTKKAHITCPCGLSEQFAINDRGWGKCFSGSCSEGGEAHKFSPSVLKTKGYDVAEAVIDDIDERTEVARAISPISDVFRAFPERKFSEATVKKFKVTVAGSKNAKFQAKYPLFNTENHHIGNKVRYPDKSFSIEGNINNAGLFGRQAFPAGSELAITVVEGQDDAMAGFEMQGYAHVSVHSASTAVKDCRRDFEYLNSFKTIVFCFDNDEAGRKAAAECANLPFPLGKVKILTLSKHKDLNDYLKAGARQQYKDEWWKAPVHKPDGLKLGSEIWDEIIDRKESFTTLYPWPTLNLQTFGIRLSEMIIVSADTGVGKTSFLKHIEHHLLTDPIIKEKGYGVGFLHLEEPNGDTALGILSIHNGVPYHLPTSERPVDEIRQAYDEVLNTDRVVIWDHFGSNSVDAVLGKIRHMYAMGCRYIVLDHLSILVSDQSGDERKQLDEIATKLKTLTMELDIAVIAVIHTNRQGQIRGTAGVEQLANIVIRLQRNKLDENEWRRNVTVVRVDKNRFCGFTGPAGHLYYNKETARLSELEAEEVATYEAGGHSIEEPWV